MLSRHHPEPHSFLTCMHDIRQHARSSCKQTCYDLQESVLACKSAAASHHGLLLLLLHLLLLLLVPAACS
jgi:hypothetical protein